MQGRIEAWNTATEFGPALSRFLLKHPFASARSIAAHFEVARNSVKMILARELGLKNSHGDGCRIG
jgi:hypothetical protein